MKRIHAGQLDRRIVIERFRTDAVRNGHGEIDSSDPASFEPVGERWARFTTGAGSERSAQGVVQAGITHRVIVRSDSLTRSITPSCRIRLGDRSFGVISVADVDEQREWVQLDLVEAVHG